MGVAGCDSEPMVNHDDISISSVRTGEDHNAIGPGFNRSPVIGRDVPARVHFKAAPKWVTSCAETICDVPANRQIVGRRCQLDLVTIKHVLDLTEFAFQRSSGL